MNTRNAPLSPVSLGGGEWPGVPPYQKPDGENPYPNNRGLISPPSSGGSNRMMNGFPPGARSIGGPSPPPSIGRSSTYARSESGRSIQEENIEAVLGEHYVALKRYLSSTSKDGRANPPPNKARDKLLRLSSVQFRELSTDVFDELVRRQRRRPPPGAPPNAGPPPYLLPEDTFHPKRNQARQKLSTLGSPRFRDLATDVFCELERRIPRFIAGDIPRMGTPGGPPSRTGTPVNGMGGPRGPGGPNRAMRRPSDASSIRSAGPPRINGEYPMPPSPGLPNGGFDRPLPKTFNSNTIVPNKSTMVEEDDDLTGSNDDDHDAFGLSNRASKRSAGTSGGASETDKKLIDDYQTQVRELRDKLDGMEDQLKKKDDELNSLMDSERSRAAASNVEKKGWEDLRTDLEGKLAEAQDLNNSMRNELERMRDDHAAESHKLREELDYAQEMAEQNKGSTDDSEAIRENRELRMALEEQQQITEHVRRETQQYLEEMRALTVQHAPSYDRQAQLEKTIEGLEQEVQTWRSNYARAKTQLRSMRASSIGLSMELDAVKYVQDKGFIAETGLVKDVYVTKFQVSIDELLRRVRTDNPEKVVHYMKLVIFRVQRITKDIDADQPNDEEIIHHRQKLRSRVSATASNLITASKNFASSAGISPVSLVDAAASHLVAALVELMRAVKIRHTPAEELEDDDDGTITPVDSAQFASTSTTTIQQDPYSEPQISPLAPPPALQAIRAGMRDSANSSAYSPVNSPRESVEQYNSRMSGNGATYGNGNMTYTGANHSDAATRNGYGPRDTDNEDLKIYLEDQSAVMVQAIQGLVGSIRGNAPIQEINDQIDSIAEVVGTVVSVTVSSGNDGEMLDRLTSCRQRLLEAGDHGNNLADRGLGDTDREWRMWTQTLPPIAFEIARVTKELVQHIDRVGISPGEEDLT
ncbi:Uu.00g035740.m01.CDS01 [Anthostomella pinea]|uniref:Uu.00g035740.m01.CDS01 n=1 Tax=Anthostomella pinea TaxID=933095 RepID=A0AAI8V9A7_9PEZI|nr:Uu.00g035740.m01.CDS01 [Anthostomella pinea]